MRRGRSARVLLSCLIFAVLLLQTGACALSLGAALWPFMSYDMYSRAYREGSIISRPSVYALHPEGSAPLGPAELGLSLHQFRQGFLPALRGTDAASRDGLERYLELYPGRRTLRGLRVVDRPLELTRQGVRPLPLAAFDVAWSEASPGETR